MKLFIDSANLDEIKKIAEMGLLGGVTTNPTLLVKHLTDNSSPKELIKKICDTACVDVLAEPISTAADDIVRESLGLCAISKYVVAKIPLTQDGIIAAGRLKKKGKRVAFTLIFSPSQALIAAALGVDYICPFVGRLDDIGQTGTDLIRDIVTIYRNYDVKTKVVVASVRSIEHIVKSAFYGAFAVTAPFKLIEEMIKHELTAKGIEKFLDDWSKVSKKL